MTTIENQVRDFIKEAEKDAKLYDSDYSAFYEKYKSFLVIYPEGEYKKKLVRDIMEAHLLSEPESNLAAFPFYQKEIDILKSIYFSDPPIEYGDDVMCALMLWKKQHPHEGGWIEYDIERILQYTFSASIIHDIVHHKTTLQDLVRFGFDMRVIGSKNPTVCYTVPTADEDEDRGKPVGYLSQSSDGLMSSLKKEWYGEWMRREREQDDGTPD